MGMQSKSITFRPFTLSLAKPQPRKWAPLHYSWICPGDPKLDQTIRLNPAKLPLWQARLPIIARLDLAAPAPGNDNSFAPLN